MTLNLKKKVTLTASQMLAENNRATADRLTWAAQTDEMNLRTALNVPENGLTEEMAEEARDRYGCNVLPTSQRTPLYKRLAAAFINPFTVVLVLLAIFSALTNVAMVDPGDESWATVIIITIMVLISGILRFVQETRSGSVRDFVAVGDVDIKVIGADNQVLDSQVPVRQILEQLVARTGIPPFMLGLSWSSTERMSTQQKAQRAREIAKKESEKLFMGTEVVHNPVKEFVPLKEVKVGQEVCIAELNQLATVMALPDKNGDVLVRAGIIKTKVPLKGLKQPEKLVKEKKPQTKAQQRYSRLTGDANRPNGRVERVQRTAKMECNLLGLTVDEALPEVDSFIDRAILNGQTVVYLIHGNGTGALRTAIHKHLRGNRMVKSFRLGRYGEGESGVTVVELK